LDSIKKLKEKEKPAIVVKKIKIPGQMNWLDNELKNKINENKNEKKCNNKKDKDVPKKMVNKLNKKQLQSQ